MRGENEVAKCAKSTYSRLENFCQAAKKKKKKLASLMKEAGGGRAGKKKNGSTERRCERRKRGRFYAYLLLDSQHCFVGGKNGCKKPINAPVFTHSRCCVHESTQVRVVMVVVVGKGVEMRGGDETRQQTNRKNLVLSTLSNV